MDHYRTYAIYKNGVSLGMTTSIEGISNEYILKEKNNCINDLIKNKIVKIEDSISFKFKYSYT